MTQENISENTNTNTKTNEKNNSFTISGELIAFKELKNNTLLIQVKSLGLGKPFIIFFNWNKENTQKLLLDHEYMIEGYTQLTHYQDQWNYKFIGEQLMRL